MYYSSEAKANELKPNSHYCISLCGSFCENKYFFCLFGKHLAYHLESFRVPPVVLVPQVGNPCLKPFESDLYDLVRKIEFENEYETRKHNNFQQKLSKDITEINSTDGIVVIADETNIFIK